jgi:nitrite reductase/ring-hydroxylating ferredoxin subunit
MSDFVRVAALPDLPPGQGLEATVDGQPVAVFNVSGTIRAIGGRCAHQGGPLGQGALLGNIVLCPWHAWGYDLETGHCDVNRDARVPVYEVRIEDGQILVRAPA